MKYKVLSTRQCCKTLESWKEYLEKIINMKIDTYNYVLYINKYFWNNYKDKLDLLDFEIEITANLPKGVNAVFMKKVDWSFKAGMKDEIINKMQHDETIYTIIPSKVKAEDLFYFITHELSFDKVLGLYILLRNAISTGKLGSDDNE